MKNQHARRCLSEPRRAWQERTGEKEKGAGEDPRSSDEDEELRCTGEQELGKRSPHFEGVHSAVDCVE